MGKIDVKGKIHEIIRHLEFIEEKCSNDLGLASSMYNDNIFSLNEEKVNVVDAISKLYDRQEESKDNVNDGRLYWQEDKVIERYELLSEAVGISESVTDADGNITNVNKLRELIGCLKKFE